MALCALILAVCGSQESLWIDELHSSWTISETFLAISSRASAGNQTPVYFWLLWLVSGAARSVLGTELALRLISILAWVVTLGLAMRRVISAAEPCGTSQRQTWLAPTVMVPLVIVGCWLVMDRIQLFYATEARVYALVQLLSLVNWLTIERFLKPTDRRLANGSFQPSQRLLIAWWAVSTLLIYLHLTAGLVVGVQWLFLMSIVGLRANRNQVRSVLLAGCAVGLAWLPLGLHSSTVWSRRTRWESFAGDASLANALSLFPLAAFAIPIAMGLLLDRALPGLRRKLQASEEAMGDSATAQVTNQREAKLCTKNRPVRLQTFVLWCVAAFGPWAIAWLVTGLEVAPLFHRRFVIGSAVPLFILAALAWLHIQRLWLRGVVAVSVLGVLLTSQGTIDNWRSGYLIGWQRSEGWRQAASWLGTQVTEGDRLWVASQLIEGAGQTTPLSSEVDIYLSYPLRGCYRVQGDAELALADSRRDQIQQEPSYRSVLPRHSTFEPDILEPDKLEPDKLEPQALVNDWRQWPTQWSAAERQHGSTGERQREPRVRYWIVYRGTAEQLQRILQALTARKKIDEPIAVKAKSFGRVAVAAIWGPIE